MGDNLKTALREVHLTLLPHQIVERRLTEIGSDETCLEIDVIASSIAASLADEPDALGYLLTEVGYFLHSKHPVDRERFRRVLRANMSGRGHEAIEFLGSPSRTENADELIFELMEEFDCPNIVTLHDWVRRGKTMAAISSKPANLIKLRVAGAEECSGHVAGADDPKICSRCGVHIDDLRPDDDHAPDRSL